MNKEKILQLCDEIENTLSDAWNNDEIEYDLAGHIVSFAKKIVAEITSPPKSNGDRIRQMPELKLRNCPFCGGSVRFDKAYSYFRDSVIYCDDCDMVFTLDDCQASDDEICEAWNRRSLLSDMCERTHERTHERRCENCIHFVPYPQSEEFDFCKIQGTCYEIYRDLPYDICTGFCPRRD